MHAVEADAPTDITAQHRDSDEMSNYYTIIRCAHCNAMIQLRRAGSKSRIRRICTACQKRLKNKQKAA